MSNNERLQTSGTNDGRTTYHRPWLTLCRVTRLEHHQYT